MSKAGSIRGSGRTAGETESDADHELREGLIPDYIDDRRSHLNSTIIETKRGPELTAICEERRGLRETKRKMKSNACVAQSILISFGKKIQPAFNALPIKTQDALYLQLMEKIAKEANTDVSGLVAHRDETAPHAHGQLVGYNREGTPLTKVMNRQFRRDMQDWMVEVFQPHLPEIERGVRKSVRLAQGDDASKTIHRSVQELHGSLGPEIEAAEAELANLIEKARKNEERAKKARAKAEADEARSAKALKNAATYERRAGSARDEISQIEAELLRLRKLQEGIKAENKKLAEQGDQIAQANGLKAEKAQKLENALQSQVDDLREEVQRLSTERERAVEAARRAAEAEAAKIRQEATEGLLAARREAEKIKREATPEKFAALEAENATLRKTLEQWASFREVMRTTLSNTLGPHWEDVRQKINNTWAKSTENAEAVQQPPQPRPSPGPDGPSGP